MILVDRDVNQVRQEQTVLMRERPRRNRFFVGAFT